jgi:hypothetical protein
MAKPWNEVAKDPAFQALSPEEREAARVEYFHDVVAPRIDTSDIPAARTEFDADTKKSALELEQQQYEEQNPFFTRLGQRVKRGYKQTIASEYAANAADIAESIGHLADPESAPPGARQQVLALSPEERRAKIEHNLDAMSTYIANFTREQKELGDIPSAPVAQAAGNAKTVGEYVSAVKTAPASYAADIAIPSTVQSAPAVTEGIVGGRIAGKTGGMIGAGIGSASVDYAAELSDAIQRAGVDTTDPEAVKKALSDPRFVANMKQQAGLHAGVVGLFDALSFGLSSKVLAPSGMRPLAREVTNAAVQLPAHGALGAAGEAGGEIAQGRPLSPGDIGAEFVGELAQGPQEIASAAAAGVREKVHSDTSAASRVVAAPNIDVAIAEADRATSPLALPAPTMYVSPEGAAGTEAQRTDLGMTPDIDRAAAAQQERDSVVDAEIVPPEEQQPQQPLLPSPTMEVSPEGEAATQAQRQDLGITPDIRSAIQAERARILAMRDARLQSDNGSGIRPIASFGDSFEPIRLEPSTNSNERRVSAAGDFTQANTGAVQGETVFRIPSAASRTIGKIDAFPSQLVVDIGTRSDAKHVGDLIDVKSIRDKPFEVLDAPSQRIVLASVIASVGQPEVLKSVVGLDAVNVVNQLTGKQFTPRCCSMIRRCSRTQRPLMLILTYPRPLPFSIHRP